MKIKNCFAIVAFLIVILRAPFSWAGGIAIEPYADHHNSGYYLARGPEEPEGLVWRFKADGRVLSPPVSAFGTVFVGSEGGTLYAVDQKSGDVKWSFKTGAHILTSPAIWQGTVLVATDDRRLCALSARSGEEIWQVKLKANVLSGLVVYSDRVLFGDNRSRFLALDAATGKKVWSRGVASISPDNYGALATIYSGFTFPAASYASVFFGSFAKDPFPATNRVSMFSRLYRSDVATGKKVWRASPRLVDTRNPLIVADNMVYVTSREGFIYAYNAETADLTWKYDLQTPIKGTGYYAGTLFAATGDGYILAFKYRTGDVEWHFKAPAPIVSNLALTTECLLAGTSDGRVLAVELAGGETRWSYRIGTEARFLKVVSDFRFLVVTDNGSLLMFAGGEDRG